MILGLSLLLSGIFAARVPFNVLGNPDETAHLEYVRLILANGGFVQFKPGDALLSETHQPPLHYIACVPVFALTVGNLPAMVFGVRMVSAVWQLLTILVAFRAGRDLFPSRPEVALAAAAFVAFLPTQAQLAGAVNNDCLTTLLCSALFWRLALLVKDGTGGDIKGAALIGLFLGLGLWTKLSVIQLIPPLLIAYAVAGNKTGLGLSGAIRGAAVALGVAVLVASPWLIRNTILYGDPLTLKIFPLTAPPDTPTPQSMMQNLPQIFGSMPDYLRIVAVRSYASFWSLLPPNVLKPEGRDLFPFVASLLIALVGLVGALRPGAQGGVADGEKRVVLFSVATVALIVPFFVRFILQFFQAQGRYFLPGLLPVALVCCVGWTNIAGKQARPALIGLCIVLFVLCLYQIARF